MGGQILYCRKRPVYSPRDQKGTRILQYIGEKIAKAESEKRLAQGNAYIFALNDHWGYRWQGALRNKARYINHSCDPNCEVHTTSRTIWLVALRDIKAGEELTFNYGYELDDETEWPGTCGAEHCCGYILAQQYWGVVKYRDRSTQREDRVNPKKRPNYLLLA